MGFPAALLVLTWATLASAAAARACIVGFGAPATAAAAADHAFCGTVIELQQDDGGRVWATLRVREIWKGDVPDTVVVTDGSSCGAPFAMGGEFVVCPGPPPVEFFNQAAHEGIDPAPRWRGPPLQAEITGCGHFGTYGDAALVTLGRPLRVGNGQSARSCTLADLVAHLAGADAAVAEAAARSLQFCAPLLECFAESGDPRQRARFDEVVAALAAALAPAPSRDPQVRVAAASALAVLGPSAAAAIPALLSSLGGLFEADRAALHATVQVGREDPRVLAALAGMAGDPADRERRDWARSMFWQGVVPMVPAAPQPAGFLRDPDPVIRGDAYRALGRTADQVGLGELAAAALADGDPAVAARALPLLITRMADDRVLPWILEALAHPDAGVRSAALGESGLRARPAAVRCAVVAAFCSSGYTDIQDRCGIARRVIGPDCD